MPARRFSRKVEAITPFRVVDFIEAALALAASGRDVIRMEAGEPAFALPPPVARVLAAPPAEVSRYSAPLGRPDLREAIARLLAERHGVALDPRRVVVTTGSSAALALICDLLLDPGDSALVTDPGYPCNPNFVRRCHAEPLFLPLAAEDGWQPDPAAVEAHWRADTALLLLASPANPTGAVIDRERLAALAAVVARRGGHLLVDEIYHGLTYGEDPPPSVLELTDQAFVVNSFSKYFGMPGWRLGFAVVPEAAVAPLTTLAQNFYIAPPAPAQAAALAALQPDCRPFYEARLAEFRARRDFLVPALAELGFQVAAAPAGAFYVYAGLGELAEDSETFCREVLAQAAVAITPGTDFSPSEGRRFVRFSFTEPLARLEEGVERLARFLGRHRAL
ncbi:MAG: aminotransferase [Porticoccaceae bacterium]|nr:MAG: aminotransferase [Porticoccaceae bacterium]